MWWWGGQSFVPLVNIQTGASHFCSSLSCGDISILAALDTKAKPPTRVTAMESAGVAIQEICMYIYIFIYIYLYPLAFSNDPISHISLNPQWWDARMLLTTTWLIILGILEWSIGKWICKTQKLLSQKLHARKIYQTGVFPLFRIVFLKFSTVGQLGNTATSVTDRHYMSHPCLTKAKLEITLGWV